jgi:Ca2+-binding RTX toxin-like protein
MRKALILAIVLATPAHAATVTVSDHEVRYTGKPGEQNVVTATFGTDDITLHDKGTTVTAGAGCAQVDEQTASCPAAALRIALGDGDDRVFVECALRAGLCGSATLIGGPGDDSLNGTVRPDILLGGPGNDKLSGGGSGDLLRGGSGDDFLVSGEVDAEETSTRIFCGPGHDTIGPVAIIGRDCEAFDSLFYGIRGRLRAHGDRLTIAVGNVRCPLEFRWGDRVTGAGRRTTFHPHGWSTVTLRIPDTGPSPHLGFRALCSDSDGFYRLFARYRTG